jgi:hypothetical protein
LCHANFNLCSPVKLAALQRFQCTKKVRNLPEIRTENTSWRTWVKAFYFRWKCNFLFIMYSVVISHHAHAGYSRSFSWHVT